MDAGFGALLNRKYAILQQQADSSATLQQAQANNTDANTAQVAANAASQRGLQGSQAGQANAGAFAQREAGKTVAPLAQSQIGLQTAQGGYLGAQAGQIHFNTDAPATDAEIGQSHRGLDSNNFGLDANSGIGLGRQPGANYTSGLDHFSAGTANVQPKGAPMATAPLPAPGVSTNTPAVAALSGSPNPGDVMSSMHSIVHHAMHALALHAAGGTTSVPSPGQTTSNGSWEGPQPTVSTPMPSTTPNQDLRAKMGFGVRAAGGATDVQPPSGVPPIAPPVRYPDNSPQSGFGQRKSLTGTVQAAGGETTVPGKGNPGVDKVPAVLAPGEAVLNSGAAHHMGRGAIAALNALGAHAMAAQGTPPQGPGANAQSNQMPPAAGGKPPMAGPPKGPQQKPMMGRGAPGMKGRPMGKAPPPKGKVAAGGKGR